MTHEEAVKDLACELYGECQCEEVAYQGDCWHCKTREKWIPVIASAIASAEKKGREEARAELEARNKHHKLHDIEHCLDVEHDLEWQRHKNKELWNQAIEESVKVALEYPVFDANECVMKKPKEYFENLKLLPYEVCKQIASQLERLKK